MDPEKVIAVRGLRDRLRPDQAPPADLIDRLRAAGRLDGRFAPDAATTRVERIERLRKRFRKD